MNVTTPALLHPKPGKSILLFVICALFVAAGIKIAMRGESVGYVVAAFFALGLPVSIVQVIPGSAYLWIDLSGLTICSLFRKTWFSWEDIDEFLVVKIRAGLAVRTLVGFNFSSSYDRSRAGRRLSKALADCEAALPDTYGQRPEDLAADLNARLEESRARDPIGQ